MTTPRALKDAARRLRATLVRLHSDERGAALFLYAFGIVITLAVGAVALDYGQVVVERRDHQKSVDAMVLAGVQELPEATALADQYAREWGVRNGVDAADVANLTIDASCWSDHPADDPTVDDSITVDVSRPGKLFFLQELGFSVDVGAHAKACVGSLREADGLRPWSISILNSPCFEHTGGSLTDPTNYQPLYGQECEIRLESPSSQVGSIRLGDDEGDVCNESGGGASKYKENIIEGSGAVCEIGEVIDTEPGLQVGPTFDALDVLLNGGTFGGVTYPGEGDCDAMHSSSPDGIDDLLESFSLPDDKIDMSGNIIYGPDTVFTPRDCNGAGNWDGDPGTPDTPRFVSLVLIDEFDSPTGFDSEAIVAFAGFYIDRCDAVDKDGNVIAFPKCDVPSGLRSNVSIVGTFIQYLRLGGPGGPLDPFGSRIYALVE